MSTDITNLGTVNGVQAGFPASLAAQEVFKQLPFLVFNDVGGGVGGTADYNNFVYASENSDANATITKIIGKHEISTGFEWMKRYLNVGQPPAPAGSYLFDITATDQIRCQFGWRQRLRLHTHRHGINSWQRIE